MLACCRVRTAFTERGQPFSRRDSHPAIEHRLPADGDFSACFLAQCGKRHSVRVCQPLRLRDRGGGETRAVPYFSRLRPPRIRRGRPDRWLHPASGVPQGGSTASRHRHSRNGDLLFDLFMERICVRSAAEQSQTGLQSRFCAGSRLTAGGLTAGCPVSRLHAAIAFRHPGLRLLETA